MRRPIPISGLACGPGAEPRTSDQKGLTLEVPGRSAERGSGLPVAGYGVSSTGVVAGSGQHPAQVDNCLGVDVFMRGRVEVLGLRPDGHGALAAGLLLG